MNRIKVLHVVTTLQYGGIENVAVNFIRYLDKEKFQIDYLVCNDVKGEYEQEIGALGGRVIRFDCKVNHIRAFVKELKLLLKSEKYEIVHSHILFRSAFVLKVAKECGIKERIAHSHTTKIDVKYNYLKIIYQFFMRRALNKYATLKVGCGRDAGLFLFGHSFDKSGIIIKNGVDVEKYKYNPIVRKRVREELGIMDDILLISVARLFPVKNHQYMIKIIKKLKQNGVKAKLLVVGDGYLKKELLQIVKKEKLENEVIFTGSRSDVADLLQGADFFLMPSLFEGLPLSMIEAQAAGLYCLASDNVTREVDITEQVCFLHLDEDVGNWCKYIKSKAEYSRRDTAKIVREKGYDLNSNFRWVEKMYINNLKYVSQ